ncbi:TetR/AcrR family transcriptional regulator [Streptosporangium amethystogenes]|uniref:TetR/AcrR family transcriptional regulator n=1 Tax=Streptosporangium amethystogenes TaxID=2002 RepID=UPI0004C4DFB6|nr:TetR/AcrR family transcriptional regulator [Streptosporangium amethystogenes]
MPTTHKDAGADSPVRNPSPGSRRRADAERSVTAILDAALTAFGENPEVSMTGIARAAGVGRVTLYSHFPSREDLLDAVMTHAVQEANAALGAESSPEIPVREALEMLIGSSWRILSRYGRLQPTALRILGPERVREHHDQPLVRVRDIIVRGRREGVIRDDLPESWLVTVFYSLLHAAALEVDAGRLPAETAADTLTTTLLSTLGVST